MLPLRKMVLVVALIATLGASLYDWPGTEAAQPKTPGIAALAKAAPTVPKPADTPAQAVSRAPVDVEAENLFASKNWQPPPPPISVKVEAPKAPPLPFTYLGKKVEDGEVIAFIAQGARTHLLHKGDVVSDYKVDAITAAEMSLIYLPLNEKQLLKFGSSN